MISKVTHTTGIPILCLNGVKMSFNSFDRETEAIAMPVFCHALLAYVKQEWHLFEAGGDISSAVNPSPLCNSVVRTLSSSQIKEKPRHLGSYATSCMEILVMESKNVISLLE